jgi:purine-nucleoside phosphorylase
MNGSKKEASIIKPQPIKGIRGERVVYIPVDSPTLTLQKALKKRSRKQKISPFGHLFFLKNTTVLYQCVGAPLAVLSLERLIASGIQEILILGFCGALNEHADIGEAVSIVEATSDEGTSRHYCPRKKIFRASPHFQRNVESVLRDRELPFIHGSVVSTDAPFRETHLWLKRHRAKGIGFVDMETSAVFALADFYGVQAAALLLVSDRLTSSTHQMGFHSIKILTNIRKYFLPFLDSDQP